GREFPARIPATASGGFCPIPIPTGKIPRLRIPIRGVPEGIPVAWGILTPLDAVAANLLYSVATGTVMVAMVMAAVIVAVMVIVKNNSGDDR
ncbi:hypothetical protein PIB30_105384, partial [Stylosanthes scabra]|nr:hypothetical protein [Stylosanthes scabra]